MGSLWYAAHTLLSVNQTDSLLKVDSEGPGMDDAAGFFANVFGGERFEEYVRGRLASVEAKC